MTETPDLVTAVAPIREELLARHDARETAFAASRDAIRASANAIRAVHRGEDALVATLLVQARQALEVASAAADGHPEVRHAGFLADAAKELAEAELTRAAVAGEALPDPTALGIDALSWLHGLAETVGELRRASLDRVRGGDLDRAESYLALMQEILSALATIDVPDGLSRGLRRATDAARAITERTRGDLTTAVGQRELRRALDAHREALERARS
ncbi:MAG: haloacid dehalogenase [Nitriliruptoraceae bacterium]